MIFFNVTKQIITIAVQNVYKKSISQSIMSESAAIFN